MRAADPFILLAGSQKLPLCQTCMEPPQTDELAGILLLYQTTWDS